MKNRSKHEIPRLAVEAFERAEAASAALGHLVEIEVSDDPFARPRKWPKDAQLLVCFTSDEKDEAGFRHCEVLPCRLESVAAVALSAVMFARTMLPADTRSAKIA